MWTFGEAEDKALEETLSNSLDEFNKAALGDKIDRTNVHVTIKHEDTEGIAAGLIARGMRASAWMYIHVLFVRDDKRRQGLGTKLLELAAEKAAEKGFQGLTVQTLETQAPDFYRRQGFSEYGRLEEGFGGRTRFYFKKRF